MAAQVQTAVRTAQRQKRELEDLQLVMRVRNGDDRARELLIRRYTGFVRMKASSTSSQAASRKISSRKG